ncbi:hypothetical protein BDZ97DRAFT_394364 [Flammula alnicola]|nr:hypothetical protein BDZ97DRAFT_394364 [Flammula alnicola]
MLLRFFPTRSVTTQCALDSLDTLNEFKSHIFLFLHPPFTYFTAFPTHSTMDCPSSSVDVMATVNDTAAPKSTTANASDNADKGKGKATAAVEPRLPSFEEATGVIDCSRLPSYRQTRVGRFHPYMRTVPVLADGTGIDRLFNTIYDEERVELNVPPARRGAQLTVPPLVPRVEGEELRQQLDDTLHNIQEYDRRRHNVAAVILNEFIAGLTRAM